MCEVNLAYRTFRKLYLLPSSSISNIVSPVVLCLNHSFFPAVLFGCETWLFHVEGEAGWDVGEYGNEEDILAREERGNRGVEKTA